jgi:hypothetical protein
LKFRIVAALLLSSFLLGTAQANAITAVPKATRVVVSTTSTTAKVSWPAFAKSKVTAIKVTATAGVSKSTKTLAKSATSHVFYNLKSFTLYTFSVTAYFGSKAGAAVTYKLRTKAKPSLLYNSIFFGAPQDMVVGDQDQELWALPNGGETTFTTTTPTKCIIVDGFMLRALAMGECTVVASNPGDAYYQAAESVIHSMTITAPIASLNKTLLWEDNFDGAAGTGPNSSNWGITTGHGCGTAAGCGWGNGESESYAACANKHDGNGVMVITASTPTGDSVCKSNKTWTSGKFTSFGKKHFGYGYFEARLKMPSGGGTWPAFWTLGTNINSVPWPACGELDIMEYAGNVPLRTTSAGHYANSSGSHEYKSGAIINNTELSEEYHTYGMLWLPNEVTFVFDGRPVFILKKSDTGLSRWPFGPNAQGVHPKMYLIFNLAMGGNYGGAIDSSLHKATFSLDYVRYYSVDGYGSAPTN